jgi:hypothetical protein
VIRALKIVKTNIKSINAAKISSQRRIIINWMRERFEMLFQNLDADSRKNNDRDESDESKCEMPQKKKYLTDFY